MVLLFKTRLAAFLCASLVVAQPHAYATAAAPSATVQLNHLSIVKIGKGSPVILIPGLSSPRAVWDGIAPTIARTRTVYLVQLNGFGGSDATGNLGPGIIDGVIADLHSYIVANKLKRVAVIGHSLGGLIALDNAKVHPGDVAKVMVVDAPPYVGALYRPGATVAQLEPMARIMRDKTVASYGKPIDDAQAAASANALALKPGSRTAVAAWVKTADPRVTAEALYEDMTTDLRSDLATISTPITLVYPWSANMPEAKASALYRSEYAKAPNIIFVPVGDSAHFVMLDQPEVFIAAVSAFLAN